MKTRYATREKFNGQALSLSRVVLYADSAAGVMAGVVEAIDSPEEFSLTTGRLLKTSMFVGEPVLTAEDDGIFVKLSDGQWCFPPRV